MIIGIMNIGIIGTGNIASSGHGPAIKSLDGTQLTSVLSRETQKGKEFLNEFGASDAKVYTDIKPFVNNPNIELVIITSPDSMHYEQAKACLENGKHVLMEKPFTISVGEAENLAKIAEERRLTLAVGFHLRSHNGHRLLKKQIASGVIGDLRHIRLIWAWQVTDDSNWRAHDKLTRWWSLSAVGSHCIDLARWLGDDMDDWSAFSSLLANNLWGGEHDETAQITGQFKSGITFDITSSVQFGPFNKIEIFGSKGEVTCEDTLGRNGAGTILVNGKDMQFEASSPFVEQLRNTLTHIESDTPLNADYSCGVRSVKDLNLALN